MLLTIGFSAVYIYEMQKLNNLEASITGVFKIASWLVVPSLYVILMVPSIAYLCHLCPIIVTDMNLPAPKMLKMFVFNKALQIIHSALMIWFWLNIGVDKITYGITIAFVIGEAGLLLITIFIIGVFTNVTSKTIQDSKIWFYSSDEIKEVYKTVKNAKSGIGPCLLIIFTLNCITLINSFLVISTGLGDNVVGVILNSIKIISTVLELIYLTLVVESTSSVYKDLAIRLRY